MGNFCWSPDGGQVAFTRYGYNSGLYVKKIEGGDEEAVVRGAGLLRLCDWSPTNSYILYSRAMHERGGLWTVRPGEEPVPFLVTDFEEHSGKFSPDGRWVAYVSDNSGREEIYVQSFEDPSRAPMPISANGGEFPRWRADGEELFYISDDEFLMAVPVNTGPPFEVGIPQRLFEVNEEFIGQFIDVSRDGQRFLFRSAVPDVAPRPYTVVVNWLSELKR